MRHIIDEFILDFNVNRTTILEERISIVLQPKPWWLPRKLWFAVIRRLIRLEIKIP